MIHRIESRRGVFGACLLLTALLSACATLDGVTTAVVAEKRVEHVIAGRGAPAVVFENGLGGTLDWWAKVLPEVSTYTTTFAYNRPGIGSSARAATPRDGDHIVDELRRVLRDRKIFPPYVLVGHSIGGLYMQLYARRHPDEVAGLVLVDSTHPEQMKGAGAREHWPIWLKVVIDVTADSTAQAELAAIPATGASILALPPFTGKPAVVLSAKEPMSETSDLARDANAKRVDILRLHPGAKQVWVDSGHAIPLDWPKAVVDAIREVVESSRASGG